MESNGAFKDCDGSRLRGSSQAFLITLDQELPDLAQVGRNHTCGDGSCKSVLACFGSHPISSMMLQTLYNIKCLNQLQTRSDVCSADSLSLPLQLHALIPWIWAVYGGCVKVSWGLGVHPITLKLTYLMSNLPTPRSSFPRFSEPV